MNKLTPFGENIELGGRVRLKNMRHLKNEIDFRMLSLSLSLKINDIYDAFVEEDHSIYM